MNVQDRFGCTSLHLAAHSRDHDNQRVCVIKELLNVKNINPNSVTDGRFLDAADFEDSRLRITALHFCIPDLMF